MFKICVIIVSGVNTKGVSDLEALEIARRAVEIGTQKQAADILLLDARETCGFTDYMVILTGESDRQINTIREEILQSLKNSGTYARHVEGNIDSGWVLLDYIDTVVHIFAPNERRFYNLDALWPKATPVVHIQ